MTALAHTDTIRESRIYRVNAWRELKGRPEIDFDAPKLRLVKGSRPPEWWTAENTAKWQAAVWRGDVEVGEAQRTWGRMYGHGDRIARGHFPPPTKAQYKAWEQDYLNRIGAK
jgi:hypothetical protein